MPSQYSVELTVQVYINTKDGMLPVHMSTIPESLSLNIQLAMQRAMAVLAITGDSLSVVVEVLEGDPNGS